MSEKVSLEVGTDDDKKVLEVEKPVAEMSKTVKDMLADLGGDNAIPLPNVSPNVMDKVLEYARYHHANPTPKEELEAEEKKTKRERLNNRGEWDTKFIEEVDQDMLFKLMLAANYLDIKPLLDLCAMTVALKIKDKDAEGIRQTFNLPRVFTEEQEKELRAEIDKIE